MSDREIPRVLARRNLLALRTGGQAASGTPAAASRFLARPTPETVWAYDCAARRAVLYYTIRPIDLSQ
jgi:hypothetical protein